MGWCPEFGRRIHASCEHPMVAGTQSCTCEVCGTVCRGKFGGCKDVWLAGPVRRTPGMIGLPLLKANATALPPAAATPTSGQPPVAAQPAAAEAPAAPPPTVLAPTTATQSPADHRLDQLESTVAHLAMRVDNMALDLGDALRMMRATTPDRRLDELNQRVETMGSELRQAAKQLQRPQVVLPENLASIDDVRELDDRINGLGKELHSILNLVIRRGSSTKLSDQTG
jgi:hypothetical protein